MTRQVRVKLSALLHRVANWQEVVDVSGETPLQCLEELETRYPDMRKWTRAKDGALLPQLHFFWNGERIYRDELGRQLGDGDELFIGIAVLGG